MYTEEEASKIFCPLAMLNEENIQKCAGHKCMAWRWGEHEVRDGKWVPIGYCGLGGKP